MIRLTPFGPADFPWLIRQIDSRDLLLQWSGNGFEFPLTEGQLRRHLANTRRKDPRYFYHTVRTTTTAEKIGYAEISRLGPNRAAFLSRILIAPQYRRKGYGLALVNRLIDLSFQRYSLHRIELNVFSFNQSAIRCYERAGMIREGVLRESCFTGEEFWDVIRMAILRPEWERKNNGEQIPDSNK